MKTRFLDIFYEHDVPHMNPYQQQNWLEEMIGKASTVEEAEKWIAMDGEFVLRYVESVLKGPFPKGEDAIAHDPYLAASYAETTGKPFPKGEDAIAKSAGHSKWYAREILKGRFKKGEPEILSSGNRDFIGDYLNETVRSRWPEAEDVLAKDPALSYIYANTALGGQRFEKGERSIAEQGGLWPYQYAKYILKRRFKEAEPFIKWKSPRHWHHYKEEFGIEEENDED